MDGVGEWATTTLASGAGNSLAIAKEIHFPHSLGLLYSAFTYYTGFKVNSGEYKVMGLAPYGEPKYAGIDPRPSDRRQDDGSFQLDMDYFDYCTGLTMTNARFDALFGGPPRKPEQLLTPAPHGSRRLDPGVCRGGRCCGSRAASPKETGASNLCLAGGVALNCVANGKLLRDGSFRGDLDSAGGRRRRRRARRGAARLPLMLQGQPRQSAAATRCRAPISGRRYDQSDIERRLTAVGAGSSRDDEDD